MLDMKKLQLYYTFIALFVVCFACQNGGAYKKNKDLIYIHIDSLANENLIINNIHRHRFLPLETTQESLMAHIRKIEFDDGKIFIFDINDRLFVFEKETGKFLHTIGRIGQGPGEHLNMRDFYLDRNNRTVNIIDIFRMEIFSYSYAGELKDRTCIAVHRQIFNNFSEVHLTADNAMVLRMTNSPVSLYNFNLLSGIGFKRAENSTPYLFVGSTMRERALRNSIAHNESSIFLSAMVSDTIFRYDPEIRNIVPYMVFKGRYRPITTRDIGRRELEGGLDVLRIASARRLSFGINLFVMTDRHLHFRFETHSGAYRVFWNLETNKGSIYNSFIRDATTAGAVLNNLFLSVIGATNDAFVGVLYPHQFDEDFLRAFGDFQPIREVYRAMQEDDNPILIFYYID